jgi:uncharacterized protein YejL (UPF0352 family)
LLSPQRQQLSVGGEDLRYRLFKLPALLHQALNFPDPFVGDVLHPFLAADHESEGPEGVTLFVLGAMATGLATAAVSEGKRTRKQVGGDGEAVEEFILALAETSGLGTFRCDLHMHVIIHAERESQALFSGMRK